MRVPVPLRRAYQVINHGPTVLVGSAHGDKRNVMAAAWAMALDYDPPKVAVVIAADTYTRKLVDASAEFTLNLPTEAMLDVTWNVGSVNGEAVDKFSRFGVQTFPAQVVKAPLIDGCVGWLECKVIPNEALARDFGLFLAEVVAAQVEDSVFQDGEWRFGDSKQRTIHHLSRGAFLASGPLLRAKKL